MCIYIYMLGLFACFVYCCLCLEECLASSGHAKDAMDREKIWWF